MVMGRASSEVVQPKNCTATDKRNSIKSSRAELSLEKVEEKLTFLLFRKLINAGEKLEKVPEGAKQQCRQSVGHFSEEFLFG